MTSKIEVKGRRGIIIEGVSPRRCKRSVHQAAKYFGEVARSKTIGG